MENAAYLATDEYASTPLLDFAQGGTKRAKPNERQGDARGLSC